MIGEENGLKKSHNSRMLGELERVLNSEIDGAIADIGCWQGTVSFLMAEILIRRNIDKTIYLFDTFEGHKESQITEIDKQWAFIDNLDHFKVDNIVNNIIKTFKEIGYSNYKIVKGDILETFALDYPKFCFASLDLNFYGPTVSAINFMEEHMTTGGVIIEDDYDNIDGITKAFDENKNIKIINQFHPGASFGFYI